MLDYINYLNVCRYIADLETQIRDIGIHLELRTDFGYLVRLSESLPGKPYPTAMLNPLHHHIGPENGFWIKGTDDNGEIVHVQAVRYDDLTGTNLAREYENLSAFYIDPLVSAEKTEWCKSFAPIAKRITGPVCYHGEMWLRDGENGFRGKGLSQLLPRLAMALALIQWNPSFMFGFGYGKLINNGVMLQYGYSHFQPSVIHWHRPSRETPLDVWVVWMSQQDLRDMVSNTQERDIDMRRQVRQTDQDRSPVYKAAAE